MICEPFLQRVRIRNYKSIGHCDVRLGSITALVGRNGSGKSNFLDALRFLVEGLQTSLDHAIKNRGGIDEVRRRSTGHPRNFAIELEINVQPLQIATYGFEIAAKPRGGFHVKTEKLRIIKPDGTRLAEYYLQDQQLIRKTVDALPPVPTDRLYLVTASGQPEFRDVYDALLAMGFYNLNPEQMKEPQPPDAGELLRRDGSNIASVVARLADDRPEIKQRIKDYLQAIVPDILEFERVALAHRETLQFRQQVEGAAYPWRFFAQSMSDGTLRALGILVSVMQLANRTNPVRLIGIEEPETALHPAAAGALMDSLKEAASQTQVLLTTHSPDLLDQFDAVHDDLLVVQAKQGTTEIAPVDPASLEAIKNHLYTAGELLRMDQLQPNQEDLENQMELVFD